MKKVLLVFFAVILISFFFIIQNNSNPDIIISQLLKKGDIRGGELRYTVNFLNLFPVGEAVFLPQKEEEYHGQKVYHLSAKAKNLDIYSGFFTAQASVDSYIDTTSFNPLVFRQRLSVKGRNDILKEVIYDQKSKVMTITGIERQIFPDTQDPLSAIYKVKNMDLNRNKEFSININTNQKNYILKGTSQQRNISINKKAYKLYFIKASIARRDKNPYHKSHVSMILLQQDKQNIPILMKVFAGGILINIKLVETK